MMLSLLLAALLADGRDPNKFVSTEGGSTPHTTNGVVRASGLPSGVGGQRQAGSPHYTDGVRVGKSTAGEPMHELWTRRKDVGI